jgi:hypothetical protein
MSITILLRSVMGMQFLYRKEVKMFITWTVMKNELGPLGTKAIIWMDILG